MFLDRLALGERRRKEKGNLGSLDERGKTVFVASMEHSFHRRCKTTMLTTAAGIIAGAGLEFYRPTRENRVRDVKPVTVCRL